MKYLIPVLSICALLFTGCGSIKEQMEQIKEMERREANGIAKVKIAENGGIYLNQKLATMEELNKELAHIKEVEGVVWYHRGSTNQTAEASGKLVIEEIAKYKLPIKLVEKDFD